MDKGMKGINKEGSAKRMGDTLKRYVMWGLQ